MVMKISQAGRVSMVKTSLWSSKLNIIIDRVHMYEPYQLFSKNHIGVRQE